jgi:hypothetical protein
MAMPKKRLRDLVRDRSFLARRHEHLLMSETLSPGWGGELVELQKRFRAAADAEERRRLSLSFERWLRDPYAEMLERLLREMPVPSESRRSPPRRGPTLLERVLDNSFNPSRHGGLLEGEPLPEACPVKGKRRVWDELRATHDRYRLIDEYPFYVERQYQASADGLRVLFCSEFGLLVRERKRENEDQSASSRSATIVAGSVSGAMTLSCASDAEDTPMRSSGGC